MLKYLILLTLFITPVISSAEVCAKHLKPELHVWVTAYIKHQTQLRRAKGLDVQEIDIEKVMKKAPKKISPEKPLVIGKPFSPIYLTNDRFLVPRPKTDDANFLNHVYEFDGITLVRAIPALEYFISQIEEDTIHISRSMSYEEWNIWQTKGIAGLRESVPRNNWGYTEPKLHFALGPYSYYRRANSITFAVPKEVLLKWGKKNLASIGMERWESHSKLTEIVILDGAWEELAGLQRW